MAIYKAIQSSDARTNTFIDLPNYQWHGSYLVDKKTQDLVKNEGIEKLSLIGDFTANSADIDKGFKGLISISDIDPFAEKKFKRIYNSFGHGFGLGRFGYLVSNHPVIEGEPSIYNDLEDIPAPYIIDKLDKNIAYFVYISPCYISGVCLVKYDLAENEVIWRQEYKDFYITENGIPVNTEDAHLTPGVIQFKELTQTDDLIYFIITIRTTNMSDSSYPCDDFGKAILAINKSNGKIKLGPEITSLRLDCLYPENIGLKESEVGTYETEHMIRPWAKKYTYYNLNTRGSGGVLVPIDITDNEILLFTIVYDSEFDPRLYYQADAKDGYAGPYGGAWGGSSRYYYVLRDYDIRSYPAASRFKAGFVKYNLSTKVYDIPTDIYFPEDSEKVFNKYLDNYESYDALTNIYTIEMSVLSNGYQFGDYYNNRHTRYLRNYQSYGYFMSFFLYQVYNTSYSPMCKPTLNYTEFPKASALDKDYQDEYVLYSCLGGMLFPEYFGVSKDYQAEYRRVYRFSYDKKTKKQKAEPLTMLNKEGQTLTRSDWGKIAYDYQSYTQPWIVKSEGKKYLAVLANISNPIAQNHMGTALDNARIKTDSEYRVYNGHTYKEFKEYKTWFDAEKACEELGGHLAVITDSSEQAFINGWITSGTHWIGARKFNGSWKWVAGKPWSYTYFNSSRPNGTGDYLYMDSQLWTDGVPTTERYYICEWDYIYPGIGEHYVYYNSLYLFEFLDENTLQLRDTLEIPFTDIFWENTNHFVLANDECISHWKVSDSRFVNYRNTYPEKPENKFMFVCYDDDNKLWYFESDYSEDNTLYNSYTIHYVSGTVLEKIQLVKELENFKYDGVDINTYIELSALNTYNERLIRKFSVHIDGNAKFNDGTKDIVVNTLDTGSLRIPVTITGKDEINYTIKLIKEV